MQADTLNLTGGTAQVEWRRSARARRISLRIDPKRAIVVVTLPTRASQRAGAALLAGNAAWVERRLAALPRAVILADGASVPLDGVPRLIRHRPDARGGAWVTEDAIEVSGAPEFVARRVRDLLQKEASRRFADLVARKTAQAGLVARRVTVKDTKTRWGSCAADGSLAFSWRLAMAPPFVQDYVAGHEVAHLQHMNHGPRFWALVETLTVHRVQAVDWLKLHGTALMRVG